MYQESVQLDPLNSPHPVPWNWVLANQSEASTSGLTRLCSYRSPALMSPDSQYAAYSRIQMQAQPNFTQSRVNSQLCLEQLRSRDVLTLEPTSPFTEYPGQKHVQNQPGTVVMMIPIAWSAAGDRLLVRTFAARFGSDLASDYAVIWERSTHRTQTLSPTQIYYTHAILLGWSRRHAERVLFQAGILGQTEWPLWTVEPSGRTLVASGDQPQVFGQVVDQLWFGSQLQP
ncbi:hypothetical protein [Neosynechococcus sphagnicola]|uniref:hypothetical protein n=1 Tax=Neosynechococcus sphagnicola TaxID=1501145 RepID=UPI00055B0982|nr:hypothetical protein [Neosynechococcus sphagnicola]